MPSATRVLEEHTVLQCRSLDRLYLNAYVPELQRPETVKRFLERERTPIASPALFRSRSEAFVRDLRAYAVAHGAPWVTFERRERKEDRIRPYFEADEGPLLPGPWRSGWPRCGFRGFPDRHSDPIRTLVPIVSGHPFGVSGHLRSSRSDAVR